MERSQQPNRPKMFGVVSSFSAHIMPAIVGFLFRVIYLAAKGYFEAARGYASLFGVTVALGLVMGTFSGAVSVFIDKVAPKKWFQDSNNWECVGEKAEHK
eukprot:gnl/Chilomastix_caulleri/2203.p1 GENE.gnl/Chilomastix_caulleri/2203~~gnl/Chilomastix_caulleri/2203.p1  ORF type:complete len:100 (+),score=25.33 gnl/Chilomastix_caulleri/2203:180-479(+)